MFVIFWSADNNATYARRVRINLKCEERGHNKLHLYVASLSADEKRTNIQNDLHDYVNSSYLLKILTKNEEKLKYIWLQNNCAAATSL